MCEEEIDRWWTAGQFLLNLNRAFVGQQRARDSGSRAVLTELQSLAYQPASRPDFVVMWKSDTIVSEEFACWRWLSELALHQKKILLFAETGGCYRKEIRRRLESVAPFSQAVWVIPSIRVFQRNPLRSNTLVFIHSLITANVLHLV